jgi:hypothetical protein
LGIAAGLEFRRCNMGAMPRLQIKDDLHYRPGSTNESENCRYCKSFVSDHVIIETADRQRIENRCRIIGLKGSVRYRVRPDYRCDAQELDKDKCWWMKDAGDGV